MSDDDDQQGGAKPKRIADHAREYDVSERTVKRWNATGHAAEPPDMPPLDFPELMLAWWARHMAQAVPRGISAAVVRWRISHQSTPATVMELPVTLAPAILPADKAAERQAVMDRPISDDEIGTAHTLKRLLETEVRLSRLATDPGQAKPWLDTVARIGPMVEKLRKEDELQRKLIPRVEAETAIQSFHVPIKNEVYLLASTMCQVIGLPLTPDIEEKWRAECDRLFHRLKETILAA